MYHIAPPPRHITALQDHIPSQLRNIALPPRHIMLERCHITSRLRHIVEFLGDMTKKFHPISQALFHIKQSSRNII
jgi:hypothetical protein